MPSSRRSNRILAEAKSHSQMRRTHASSFVLTQHHNGLTARSTSPTTDNSRQAQRRASGGPTTKLYHNVILRFHERLPAGVTAPRTAAETSRPAIRHMAEASPLSG